MSSDGIRDTVGKHERAYDHRINRDLQDILIRKDLGRGKKIVFSSDVIADGFYNGDGLPVASVIEYKNEKELGIDQYSDSVADLCAAMEDNSTICIPVSNAFSGLPNAQYGILRIHRCSSIRTSLAFQLYNFTLNSIPHMYKGSYRSDTGVIWNKLLLEEEFIEDGTFEPYFLGQTTAGSFAYDTQTGYYRRQGEFCHVHFKVQISNCSSAPLGNLLLGGFPFLFYGYAWQDSIAMSYTIPSTGISNMEKVFAMYIRGNTDTMGLRYYDVNGNVNTMSVANTPISTGSLNIYIEGGGIVRITE